MLPSIDSLLALRHLESSTRITLASKLVDRNELDANGSTLYLWHIAPSIAEEQEKHGLNSDNTHVLGLATFMWQRFDTQQSAFWAAQTGELLSGSCKPFDSKVLTKFFAEVGADDCVDSTRGESEDEAISGSSRSVETSHGSFSKLREIRVRLQDLQILESISGPRALLSKSAHKSLAKVARLLGNTGFVLFAFQDSELMRSHEGEDAIQPDLEHEWSALRGYEKRAWRQMTTALKFALYHEKVLAFRELQQLANARSHSTDRRRGIDDAKRLNFRKDARSLNDCKVGSLRGTGQRKNTQFLTKSCNTAGRKEARKTRLEARLLKASAMPKADVRSLLHLSEFSFL